MYEVEIERGRWLYAVQIKQRLELPGDWIQVDRGMPQRALTKHGAQRKARRLLARHLNSAD